MTIPTIHLILEEGKSACGKKKGNGMDYDDFVKEMNDEDSLLAMIAMCEKCKQIAAKKINVK